MLQKCLQFSKHHDMNEYCTMFKMLSHSSVWSFYKIKKIRNLFDWLKIKKWMLLCLLLIQTHWPHYGLQLLYWFNLLSTFEHIILAYYEFWLKSNHTCTINMYDSWVQKVFSFRRKSKARYFFVEFIFFLESQFLSLNKKLHNRHDPVY